MGVDALVQLAPLIYIQQPDYWGIEVVGCQHGFGIPIMVPYSVTLTSPTSSARPASR